MISFKDMTFCPYYEDCFYAKDCNRPLTEEVRNAAEDWWGAEYPPISIYSSKPSCWYGEEDGNKW